ncbi:MAG: TetR family transcriptional regulator [Bacteroidota bacterium]
MEKADKKTDILVAAEKLFSELGYDGTSTRQIAKESNSNIAMINYYFGSKEGVFNEIMDNRIAGFNSQLNTIEKENIPAKEKLLKVADKYASRIFANISFHKMMQRELSLSQRPEMFGRIREAMINNLIIIEAIIERGISEKQFRKVDTRMLISSITGTITNVVVSPGKVMKDPNFDITNDKAREILRKRVVAHLQDLLITHLTPQK